MHSLPGGVRVSFIPTTVGMVEMSVPILTTSEGNGANIGPIVGAALVGLLPFLFGAGLVEQPSPPPPVVTPAPPSPGPVATAPVPPPPAAVTPPPGPAPVPVPAPVAPSVAPPPIVLPSAQKPSVAPPAIVLPSAQQRPAPKVVAVSAARLQAAAQKRPQPARKALPFTGAEAAGFFIPGIGLISLGFLLRWRRFVRPRS